MAERVGVQGPPGSVRCRAVTRSCSGDAARRQQHHGRHPGPVGAAPGHASRDQSLGPMSASAATDTPSSAGYSSPPRDGATFGLGIRSYLANGDGQRPNIGQIRLLQGIKSDYRRSDEHEHLRTSRYFSWQREPRRLVSHLIPKLAVRKLFEKTTLSWSPVTESNSRPSPYHAYRFRLMTSR